MSCTARAAKAGATAIIGVWLACCSTTSAWAQDPTTTVDTTPTTVDTTPPTTVDTTPTTVDTTPPTEPPPTDPPSTPPVTTRPTPTRPPTPNTTSRPQPASTTTTTIVDPGTSVPGTIAVAPGTVPESSTTVLPVAAAPVPSTTVPGPVPLPTFTPDTSPAASSRAISILIIAVLALMGAAVGVASLRRGPSVASSSNGSALAGTAVGGIDEGHDGAVVPGFGSGSGDASTRAGDAAFALGALSFVDLDTVASVGSDPTIAPLSAVSTSDPVAPRRSNGDLDEDRGHDEDRERGEHETMTEIAASVEPEGDPGAENEFVFQAFPPDDPASPTASRNARPAGSRSEVLGAAASGSFSSWMAASGTTLAPVGSESNASAGPGDGTEQSPDRARLGGRRAKKRGSGAPAAIWPTDASEPSEPSGPSTVGASTPAPAPTPSPAFAPPMLAGPAWAVAADAAEPIASDIDLDARSGEATVTSERADAAPALPPMVRAIDKGDTPDVAALVAMARRKQQAATDAD